MTTKLTLSIEKAVIEKAKDYASKSGRSLSDLIETYLESLVQQDQNLSSDRMPPKLKRLFGAAQIPNSLDHKKEIRKILASKDKK